MSNTSTFRKDATTSLIVLRHGQTDWNAQERFQGHADIPLNALGIEQAKRAGAALASEKFDAVYASPLVRAMRTAELVAPQASIHTDARLMEIDVGSWAGKTWDEVKRVVPGYDAMYADGVDFRRSSTGETLSDVVARAVPAMEEIAHRHAGQKVLIVAHGLLLNRAMHAMLGLEGRVLGGLGNAHYSAMGYHHQAWRLLAHNVGS